MSKKFLPLLLAACLFQQMLFADADPATGNCCPEECCGQSERPYRIDIRHIDPKGIGYKKGYTTLEGFFTLPHAIRNCWVPFIDVRGHVFNDGRPAANAGIGLRFVDSRVYGANAYYDYRKTKHGHYNQASIGFESLGRIWDFRVNGYLPFGDKNSRFFHAEFDHFSDDHMIISRKQEFALKGVNGEVGIHLDQVDCIPFYLAMGPYYLEGKGRNVYGGEFRASATFYTYLTLEARTSYDNVFHATYQGLISLNIPFGSRSNIWKNPCRSCCKELALRKRALQPVDRFEIIPLKNRHQKSTAIDPATDEPIRFVFVDNASTPLESLNLSFDGVNLKQVAISPTTGLPTSLIYKTSEVTEIPDSALPSLKIAENVSAPGDVIYVFAGNGTDTNMSSGIILKDNQRLLGSGVSHSFETTAGKITVPALTAILPKISNGTFPPFTSVVELADNNEVSGFKINDNLVAIGGIRAIHGQNITDSNINNNVITGEIVIESSNNLVIAARRLGTINFNNNVVNFNEAFAGLAILQIKSETQEAHSSPDIVNIKDNLFVDATFASIGETSAIDIRNFSKTRLNVDVENNLSSGAHFQFEEGADAAPMCVFLSKNTVVPLFILTAPQPAYIFINDSPIASNLRVIFRPDNIGEFVIQPTSLKPPAISVTNPIELTTSGFCED